MSDHEVVVTGWGRSVSALTSLHSPVDEAGIASAVKTADANGRGLIARGLGRSYGDAAQRSGGTTLRVHTGNDFEWADLESGLLTCPADKSIGEVVRFADRFGFFVPVTPGTKHVTIGGAIAADVHGKNHHNAGSFSEYVRSLRLLLADGSIVTVDRNRTRELFLATAGGMGLTGVILDAIIEMRAVSGNGIATRTMRTGDFEETAEVLMAEDDSQEYTVAWMDLAARGGKFGRGIVTSGSHDDSRTGDLRSGEGASVPSWWRAGLVNKATTKVFNELWFAKAPSSPTETIETYDSFFYPLDIVGSWNRVYGGRGFLQYQFVADVSISELRGLAAMVRDSGASTSLAVLKRFGAANASYLSFPNSGWTLAMDIPISRDPWSLESALRTLDRKIADAGGRVYLAKDSRLSPGLAELMYPEIDVFRRVRREVDPEKTFNSDLAERLKL